MKKKSVKILIISLITIIVLFAGSMALFFAGAYSPSSEALASLQDSATVDVNEDNIITFTPKNTTPTTGFIIYPGALVKAEAYAPLANEIAQAGYEVVITPMPLNFAIFGSNVADEAIAKFPNIKNWAIGGHSLGGVMAAKYASENPNIEGVVLYASYPQGDELKNTDTEVTSIYGSNDGVADLEKIAQSKDQLPTSTKFVEIDGGNHAQFGSYGNQKGDNKALISADEQTAIAASASIELLQSISK